MSDQAPENKLEDLDFADRPEQAADPASAVVDVTGDVADQTSDFSNAAESGDQDVDVVTPTDEIADSGVVEPSGQDANGSAPEIVGAEPGAGEAEATDNALQSARASGGDSSTGDLSLLLLGPAPTIAGENPVEFAQLMAALKADYADTGESGLLRRWQMETAALSILSARRGTRAKRGAWNAALADSLFKRLVDRAALEALKIDSFADLSPDGEPIEKSFRRSRLREYQQIARAAVAGDPAAIEQIKKVLGSVALETDTDVDFIALYTVQAGIDRVMRPAQADADAAFRSLEKQKKRAEKKRNTEQTNAPPTRHDLRNVSTSKRSRAPQQPKTTNPPTVIVPQPTDDGDGGAR